MLITIKRGMVVALCAAALLAATNGNALAATVASNPTLVCETGTFYYTTQYGRYVGNISTRVYGQSGGTLSISSGKSTSVSGSLQTTAAAEAGVVFSKVSVSVGVTVGLDKAVITTIGYSWTVPANQDSGWVEMGAHGYQVSWRKGHYNSPCRWHEDKSGSLLAVTKNSRFAHS